MANPQIENGHTQIANEILEHLMRVYLPPNQWQVLLCIIRKTYGFKKKVDWIANCQIVGATGLVKSTVSRALRCLEQQQLISRNGKSIGFQKNWEQWKVSRAVNNEKLAGLSTLGTELAEQPTDEKLADRKPKLADRKPKLAIQSTKVSSPRVTQKKKETIQKKLYKRKYGEFQNVLLADEEYSKLVERSGEVETKRWIENLSLGIESKGYEYKSHYATILNWKRRDDKEKSDGKGGGHSKQTGLDKQYTDPDAFRIG